MGKLLTESRAMTHRGSDVFVDRATPCSQCGAPFDALRSRFLIVAGTRVIAVCGDACRERIRRQLASGRDGATSLRDRRWWRRRVTAVATLLIGAGLLLGLRVRIDGRAADAATSLRSSTVAAAVATPIREGVLAAAAAPTADAPRAVPAPGSPLAELFGGGERWVHPLPGPARQLPVRPTRRFGVTRDHDSPESCRQGHCGVDVGTTAGETVVAVHDGVVERVVRAEGPDRSGRYVRILHRGGTVVTQYMHLDEIEPALAPGRAVRAGDHLGTVGGTGIRNSGPHLHFTVATRSGDQDHYIDPEPLLSLWPIARLQTAD